MHKVLDEDTVKPEILPQIVCGKTWLCFRRRLGGSYFMRSLRVESLAVNGRLLLRFHDAAPLAMSCMPCIRLRWRL